MGGIVVDTGPLVALIDSRDRLHARARQELDALRGGPLFVGLPALTEAFFLVEAAHLRQRLVAMLNHELMEFSAPRDLAACTKAACDWLTRYADHRPDFADAFLVCWGEQDGHRVWTFDREFSAIWRTSTGRRVRLAAKAR